jgi:hypothetical protein
MPAKGVRLTRSPKTKNAPDAGQGIGGSDQRTLSKEKNLMDPIVNQPTDTSISPDRYSKYDQLDETLYDAFGRTLDRGPAKKRIFDVARAKYTSRAEQISAIVTAAEREFATLPTVTATERALMATRNKLDEERIIRAGEPIPYLEKDRPRWADRSEDQNRYNQAHKHTTTSSMQWRTEPVNIPLSAYNHVIDEVGNIHTPWIHLDARQFAVHGKPNIGFYRHETDKDGNLLPIQPTFYALELDEAAEFAKAILLLVDHVTGVDDMIAGGE